MNWHHTKIQREKLIDDYNTVQRAKSNLDEGYPQCVTLYLALYGVAHSPNELVRDHKHQNVCITGRFHQVWDSQLRKEGGRGRKRYDIYINV